MHGWANRAFRVPCRRRRRPSVQPLLAVRNASGAADKNQTLISIVRYAADPANGRPNVREVLVSSISNATYLLYSQKLAYEFVNFATKGVFAGGRYAYLTAHNDDLFLPNGLWDPAILATREDVAGEYRITSADFTNLVTAQNQLKSKYATANAFALDFAFNGSGTTTTYGGLSRQTRADALTTAVRSNVSGSNNFRYINHTWRHWDNDSHANMQPCLGWLDDDRRDAALCDGSHAKPDRLAEAGLAAENAEQRHHGPRRPLRLEGRRLRDAGSSDIAADPLRRRRPQRRLSERHLCGRHQVRRLRTPRNPARAKRSTIPAAC